MKVPMKWLARYIDLEGVSVDEIGELLTSRGLEVAEVETLAEEISKVVVGHVSSMARHQDSDHLWICQVDVGPHNPEGERGVQIVTGAQNVSEGDLVPAALHGSTLPGGVKIKKSKMRGEMSYGMLCSGAELQLKEGDYPGAELDGIMILREDYAPGQDIKEALDLTDVVMEVEPTPNRPDWNNMIGVARELSAALKRPLNLPDVTVKAEAGKRSADSVKVRVDAPALCLRYMGRCVSNIAVAPAPLWMRRCLRAVGQRPINNIVDITNFVMMETGQPMHAFDFATVEGGQIVVRQATEGEKITTLDGKERDLPGGALVIADENKAVAVAGVMGGENSEITDQSGEVLFESAVFNASSVRRTSKTLGLASESAAHFIKGVDIEATEYALNRACQLVEELGAGVVYEGAVDVAEASTLVRRRILARPERICALLGKEVAPQEMANILNGLFIPTVLENGVLHVEVPHFRDDMEGEADVAEEVARVLGHNSIIPTLMRGELIRGGLTEAQKWVDDMHHVLCGQGAYETLSYSFTGPATYDRLGLAQDSPLRDSVAIENPFGEDNSLMRTTLLTGMLPAIALNAKRKNPQFRLYELGNVHNPNSEAGELPLERRKLCIGSYGLEEDFYALKGMVERLLAAMEIPGKAIQWKAGGQGCFHPGRKAQLWAGEELLGELGQLHPQVCSDFEIPGHACAVELDVMKLFALRRKEVKYIPISRFPEVSRDLALLVAADVESAAMEAVMAKAAGKLLVSAQLFDVYQGERLPEGQKSMAYTLRFAAADRTLTDEEVNAKIDAVLSALQEEMGAALRR